MYLFRHHLICHRAAHDVRLNEHNVCVFTSCARRWNCGLSKCWYWSRILFCRARTPQQLPGDFLNFPFTIILQKILFWSAIRSQIIFQFHFAFSLLPPPNAHMARQWIHSMAYKIKLCWSLCVALGFQFVVDEVSWVLMNRTLSSAIFSIISYSVPFLNSKWKNRILPQHNLERDQLFQLF